MKPIISLNNISKSYISADGRKRTILHDLSLQIFKNDFICIKGPSGSGKTTLLRLISGSLTPDSGDITYFNTTRENMTFMWQETALVPFFNVNENLSDTGNPSVYDFRDFLEEDIMDKYPDELSKGQIQRVLIAKSILDAKDVLFFDEPTANLDLPNVKKIANLFKKLVNDGFTLIFVSHSKFMMDIADKSFELADGKLTGI
ncbi:MAG: ATP-binding cassette domain-containing protein [Methanobacteriota archaeon]|nr:MAG: ATP-binding cassette domain-containing protein [Euryarchaeota archaeon]